jgi:hypothetical protein
MEKSMNHSLVLHGVVHGNTIELDQEPGLPDGQRVTVTVRAAHDNERLPTGESLKRAFGAWADDAADVDEYLEWNRQQRKIGRKEIDS